MGQFDAASNDYDTVFTNSCVGRAQREQVWKYVDKYVTEKASSVVEINCGTGIDAKNWKDRGKAILATDISIGMINTAKSKYPDIDFQQLDFKDISTVGKEVDTIFSNFGGLNCLDTENLEHFFIDSACILKTGDHLILVIMGKKCLWDQFYMLLKRRFKEIFRRNTTDPVLVHVEGVDVSTWYYSPDQVLELSEAGFRQVTRRPIGLFVPPSYLAPAFEKRPRLFRMAIWLDSKITFKGLSNSADHFILILERK